ncbi:MAG: hypothetical protein RRY24_08565, partial [Clostridiales bacterium]
MKAKIKDLFYRLAYLDCTGACKKADTYFYRFSREIGQNNLRMMRSMSVFMLVISFFVIASSFTHIGTRYLFHIYIGIIFFEIAVLVLIQWLLQKDFSPKICTVLTA